MNKPFLSFISAALAAVFAFALCVPAFAAGGTEIEKPVPEKCRSAYLYCFENNSTLLEYNADELVYPTSTVKMMTGIVAFEALAEKGIGLDESVTVTSDMLVGVGGYRIELYDGEVVTVGDLFYALLIGSASDAAAVLAYLSYGSVAEFVVKMNEKAQSTVIGATSTRYTNATGMHDDAMVTTARDTAKIAMYFMKNETLAEIVKKPKYVMEPSNRSIYNHNATVSSKLRAGYYDERAVGLNAGMTPVGGYSAVEVFCDPETGASYLAVVMGAEGEDEGKIYSYENAIAMMDWAFASFGYIDVLSQEQVVGEMPVTLSSAVDYVTLRPASTVSVFLPLAIDPEKDLEFHCATQLESLAAPVKAGDVVGTVTVTRDGVIVGSADLVASSDVERSEFLYVLSQIESFTKSKFFIATVISAVVLSLVYVFGKAIIRGRRNRRI